jgi:S-adenosylmethionine synthetase
MAEARTQLLTSESVTEGHPDKMADQISDAILDAILENDGEGRSAVETLLTTGVAVVAGEISTQCYVDMADIVRRTILDIGYDHTNPYFAGNTCGVLVAIQEQSRDIAQGVATGGAGDQGMMFGFATDETPELMPAPIVYAHRLARALSDARRSGAIDWLRPDGKTQVTVRYADGKPVGIDTVVLAANHTPEVACETIRETLVETVVRPNLNPDLLSPKTQFHVNSTGRFEIGGPTGDTGLTGRKLMVATYGGLARHGGGCFSGKDPTKVDRSGAYMMRYLAKNVVASGIASKCEIQVAYAIGRADPVSLAVDTFGTARVDEGAIEKTLLGLFDLSPRGIINYLDLQRPIYRPTSVFGHFGRSEASFTWERVDKAEEIRKAVGG